MVPEVILVSRGSEKRGLPSMFVNCTHTYTLPQIFLQNNWHGEGRNVTLLGNLAAGKLGGPFGNCFSSL